MVDNPTTPATPAPAPAAVVDSSGVTQKNTAALADQKRAQDDLTTSIEKERASQKALGDQFGTTIGIVAKFGETAVNAFTVANRVGEEFMQGFKGTGTAILNTQGAIEGLTKAVLLYKASTMTTTNMFAGLSGSGSNISTFSNQLDKIGDQWNFVKAGLGNGVGDIIRKLSDNASIGQQSEQSLVSLMSNSGQLNKIFTDQGRLVGDLGVQTLKYVNNLGQIAIANNQSLQATIKYSDQLGHIPGILEENVQMSNDAKDSINALSAAMKVMSGSGQGMDQVLSALNTAYDNLGNSQGEVNDKAQKGLALFSTMSNLSKDLNLQFSQTQGYLTRVAETFKDVGNNTDAAAKVLLQYTDALRKTGLTSTQSVSIIEGMIQSLSKLSTGTKAFISAQNGGPGGLQGSVQIEQLLRKGQADQVLSMVQNSLRQQFGGKIYTQAEGATSQEAASQFTRQRMLVNSGAFGNLTGGDENKATRLLEALASGNVGQFKQTTGIGDKALEQVGRQGNSLQEQSNSFLNRISVNSELMNSGIQIMALRTSQDILGVRNPELNRSLNQGRQNAEAEGKRGTDGTLDISQNVQSQDFDSKLRTMATNFIGASGDLVSQSQAVGKRAIDLGKQTVGNAANILSDVFSKEEELARQKRTDAATPKLSAPERGSLTRGASPAARANVNRASVVQNVQPGNTQRVEVQSTIALTDEARRFFTVQQETTPTPTPAGAAPVLDRQNQAAPTPGGNP